MSNEVVNVERDVVSILESVQKEKDARRRVTVDLSDDCVRMINIIKDCASALKDASFRLRNDKAFNIEAIRYNAKAFDYVLDEFKTDVSFIKKAIYANPALVKYMTGTM